MPERDSTVRHARLRPMIGLAASLLAVCCQILLLASISLAPVIVAGGPLDTIPLCHVDDATPAPQPGPGQPTHHCALCAICLAQALPPAILAPPPTLPERHGIALQRPDSAQPRAPPVRRLVAAQPRGPPSLI